MSACDVITFWWEKNRFPNATKKHVTAFFVVSGNYGHVILNM